MSKQTPNETTIKRRDFLAGASLAPFAAAPLSRAAFAQGARAIPPADAVIARLAVYPPMGIARVGNSAEWFLAPEVPGIQPEPAGRYKDGTEKIKKQVQRFRVYAFNAAGEPIREITAAEARIEWTVHVANTKAAWYGFNNPLDNKELAPGLPGPRRNQSFTTDAQRADMLVIDPGPKSIDGTSVNPNGRDPAHAMVGLFWKKMRVSLGSLGTDAGGRLLLFPGDGVSDSAIPNNPITNFADNDGWHDDWCDGIVRARVSIGGGPPIEAEHGWVACCGPHFAPEIMPFISLYDVMTSVAVEAGWTKQPEPPLSFRKHIYPLFNKIGQMQWVSAAQNLSQGWIDVGNFSNPAYIARLADAAPNNKAFRDYVLSKFRDPNSNDPQQYKLPYMLGDGINYQNSALMWFRIPAQQYRILQLWAAGKFIDDLGPANVPEIAKIEEIPIAEQPDALTRAALNPCSGGAFHPGVELTWPLRHKELYSAPYRIRPAVDRDPRLIQNLGLLLRPEQAFGGYGKTPPAIGPQMPGDLTRWMGLPWQCDAFSCQQVVFSNDFPNAVWWPALLPIDVLPQAYYDQLMDPTLPPDQRLKFFESRVMWSRGVAGIGYHASASYYDGLNAMVPLWGRMGFVVRRPGPTDPGKPAAIPAQMFVEVDRGSLDLTGNAPPNLGLPPNSRHRP
jgi:hypothetical protein